MKNSFKLISFFIFLFAGIPHLQAAKRYWVASSAAYWNSSANWSATSGGSSGASVPSASDTACFDGNGTGNDTLDVNVSIKRLDIASGFTGKIVQRTYTLTLGTGGAALSGGIFSGGSAAITVNGSFILSGTAFTSTSSTLSISGDYTFSSGSFTHHNGKTIFPVSCTLTGSTDFYQLSFAPVSSLGVYIIAAGTNLTANGDFFYEGSQGIHISGDTIKAKADVYLNNTTYYTNAGTATLSICSTSGNQTLHGAATPMLSNPVNICIKKGAVDTLFLVNTITTDRDWKLVSGKVAAGTSTFYFFNYAYGGGPTITGTQSFNDLVLDAETDLSVYTIASGSIITVKGTLSYTGTGFNNLNTGTLYAKGDITMTNALQGGGGTATIVINGTGNQSITGSSTLGIGRLCNVEINKTSGTLFLINTINVTGNWTYTAGTVDPGTSTVYFMSSKTISGTQALYNVRFWGYQAAGYSMPSGDILTVNGTLTTDGTDICGFYNVTIYAHGDISLGNVYTNNASDLYSVIYINGTGNQTLTGNTSSGGRQCSIIIDKSLGTLTLASTIAAIGDWTYIAGTIDPGSSTVIFANQARTISGSHALYNVSVADGNYLTMSSGTTITVNGDLTYISGGLGSGLYGGTFDVKGNVTINNTTIPPVFAGLGSIKLSGTGNQSLTGNGTVGGGKIPNIIIDKTSGTLTISGIISVIGGWTYIQGTVDAVTNLSNVICFGTMNLDGQGTSTTMQFYSVGVGGGTVTLTGNLNAKGNLVITSGTTLDAGSNSLTVGGKWNNNGGTWTYGTSTVTFNGSNYGTIKKTISGTPAAETFYNLAFNLRAHSQTLSSPVVVNHNLTLSRGHVKVAPGFYLELIDNATLTGGGDTAYVHGPVRKTGDDAFTFPLGDTTLADTAYHPLSMTAPASATDQFEATYFAVGQTVGDSLVDSLQSISTCEYWKWERKVGSSAPTVSLGWNKNSCNIDDYENLRLAQWNGVKWLDLAESSITVSDKRGTVTGLIAPGYTVNPSLITIGRPAVIPQYAVLRKKLDGGYYQAINGKLYFKYDEEYNDADGYLTFNIYRDNAERLAAPVTSNLVLPPPLKPHVVYGDNRYRFNTIQCEFTPSGALSNGFYILEVINEKNEHWYLRFKNDSSISVFCTTTGGGGG